MIVRARLSDVVTNRRASPSQEPHESCPPRRPDASRRSTRTSLLRLERRLGDPERARRRRSRRRPPTRTSKPCFPEPSSHAMGGLGSSLARAAVRRTGETSASASGKGSAHPPPPPAFSPRFASPCVRSVRSPRSPPTTSWWSPRCARPSRARARAVGQGHARGRSARDASPRVGDAASPG